MHTLARLALAIAAAASISACSAPGIWTATGANAAPSVAALMQSATTAKLDDKGYIRQWLILGPIAYGDTYTGDDIDKEQIKGEANFTPKPGDSQAAFSAGTTPGASAMALKLFTWQTVTTPDFFFDLNKIFALDDSTGMGAYAVAYLDAPEEIKAVKFSLCSNDNGKVFLNGTSVYSFVGGRALAEDADVVPDLTLRKGINVVVFKVWNDANDWQACIRLLSKDDKPLTNVTVRMPK